MDMDIKNQGFSSIEQIAGQYLHNVPQNRNDVSENSFKNILLKQVENEEQQELKFSKHASQRLHDRNISLSSEQLNRLEKGALLSNEKGIRDSLVLMDEMAFIVNTKSNTVITAMQKDSDGENIYTNIDGAVLV